MLSKVLGRGDAANVQTLVFPDLTDYARGLSVHDSPQGQRERTGAGESADNAGLREKLRQLEARSAAERREAFDAGRQQGEQQARAELQPVLERLNASVVEILTLRPELRSRAERDAVQLALLIAKRVLHRQLSVDEGALTALARVAFERLTRAESYQVTVHPKFASAVASALPGGYAARVRIVPDPDCALGTLVIQSAEGTIDASVDAQIEEISRGLTDRIANT